VIRERYSRQARLEVIGEAGQERLEAARVTIVGCGATGTVLANHLVRAGVGYVRIIDRDFVEPSNLQRQLLFDEDDVTYGQTKAQAAEAHLRNANSEVGIEGIVADVNATNVEEFIADVDLALDGTDNFETRYVLNDACVKLGKPWVYTGVVSTYGMTTLIRPGVTPCLRCMFPEPPPPGSAATCDTAGVLGPAVSVVASLAATEAMKWLVGAEADLGEGLLHVDAWDLTWRQFRLERKPDCPCCVRHEFPFLEPSSESHVTVLCGRNAVQITPTRLVEIDLKARAAKLRGAGKAKASGYFLRFTPSGQTERATDDAEEELTLTLFADGRAIIQGSSDLAVARSLYARYVGA
jgi:adenylyltransferase/sulfurtransferase